MNESISYSRRGALVGAGAVSAAVLAMNLPASAAAPATPGYGIDVRHLGAKGDGAADDSGAFQRALDRATSDGVHVVIVPPGTYRIGQALQATAPIRILGLGEAASTVTFDAALASGLTITQASSEEPYPGPPIELSGLTFEYGGSGAALFISEAGVRSPFQNTRVVGCRFYVSGTGTGVSSLNQRSLVIAQCQFLGGGQSTGITINDSDNTTILQNVFYHLQYGIHGARGDVRVYNAGCVVIANSMSGMVENMFFDNWESVQIVGNMIDGGTTHCIHMTDCYRSTLSGNYLGPSGPDAALLIETSSPRGGLGQIAFQDNYINHYGGTEGAAPISVVGGSAAMPVDQVTIAGNFINGYPSQGIYLKNAQNVLISGNTFNRASATADGVAAVVDDTPGSNHIVHNIVDADIVAPGDTVIENFTRKPAPS